MTLFSLQARTSLLLVVNRLNWTEFAFTHHGYIYVVYIPVMDNRYIILFIIILRPVCNLSIYTLFWGCEFKLPRGLETRLIILYN